MIAAPFLGEFGWEIAMWVPWLRWARYNLYGQRKLTVVCTPGHEGLYEDFATEVVPYKVEGITKFDCQLAWMNGVHVREPAYEIIVRHAVDHRDGRLPSVITPLEIKHTWPSGRPPLLDERQSRYHKYGDSHKYRFENYFAVHARACKHKQSGRNWSKENWLELMERIGPIGRHFAFVGSKDDALCVDHPQAEDMRGVPLNELCNILSSCGKIIGPSSGPLHLANHCGTPAVWWSGDHKNRERYDTAWNPFGVKNLCVTNAYWRPTPEKVCEVMRA